MERRTPAAAVVKQFPHETDEGEAGGLRETEKQKNEGHHGNCPGVSAFFCRLNRLQSPATPFGSDALLRSSTAK